MVQRRPTLPDRPPEKLRCDCNVQVIVCSNSIQIQIVYSRGMQGSYKETSCWAPCLQSSSTGSKGWRGCEKSCSSLSRLRLRVLTKRPRVVYRCVIWWCSPRMVHIRASAACRRVGSCRSASICNPSVPSKMSVISASSPRAAREAATTPWSCGSRAEARSPHRRYTSDSRPAARSVVRWSYPSVSRAVVSASNNSNFAASSLP